MKANIISLTSLPGGMKDVQFRLKDCYFFIFQCSEQFPVQSHVLLQLPAGRSAGACGSRLVRGEGRDRCWRVFWGKAVQGRSCRWRPPLSLPAIQPWVQHGGVGACGAMGGIESGQFLR